MTARPLEFAQADEARVASWGPGYLAVAFGCQVAPIAPEKVRQEMREGRYAARVIPNGSCHTCGEAVVGRHAFCERCKRERHLVQGRASWRRTAS